MSKSGPKLETIIGPNPLTAEAFTGTPSGDPVSRILFVDNQVADFLRYRIPLAHRLRQAGFDVHVALPQEPGLERIRSQGIPYHIFSIQRTSTRLRDEVRCLVSLHRLYRQIRPDLVHHFCLKPTLYGGISARVAGVPAMISSLTGLGHPFAARGLKMRFLRSIIACGLRFSFRHPSHRVIFQNPDDRDRLVFSGVLKAGSAVLIKGSGVDLSVFTRQPEPEGLPVILMASRLLWEKGVGVFVAAARSLRARGVQARFVLLGEPDPKHPSAVPMRALKQWHESGDVEWLGWREDMRASIAQSHIVCLPSTYGEGIPRILLEAAASGRPIVTTDIPGSREVVRHGQNGLLVPPGDREALERAIARLIQDPALRAAMGARGREIAAAEFSLERVIDANLDLHRSLIGSISMSCNRAGASF